MSPAPSSAADAPLVAVVTSVTGMAVHGRLGDDGDVHEFWPTDVVPQRFSSLSQTYGVRWVVWSAAAALRPLVGRGAAITRTWDIAEVHRLLAGGWRAEPPVAWALAHGLDPASAPRPQLTRDGFVTDLFGSADAGGSLVRPDGHLEPGWFDSPTADRAAALAAAAVDTAQRQRRSVTSLDPTGRMLRAAWSESAASVLCLELERDGLPVDRDRALELIGTHAGPRPDDDADARRIRAGRDREVLRHAPGREGTDLRNPAQVKALLSSVGLDVATTRKWALEPYRAAYPLVDALLRWRADERIATTYGYRWLDDHVGSDDRLRGAWTACDGAAGRMTAGNGLHNLPLQLRSAVAAAPGWVFVRADLGQIEPRVLAVVSGDRAFAAATRADDLYQPVAEKLGVERAVAKVAVLAAMYGQRSGAAGHAWADLERAYPVAMGVLEHAARRGAAREPLRTWGGRLISFGEGTPLGEGGDDQDSQEPTADRSAAARGRFARNAIIQGSAAELFKVWAVTTREAVRPLGAEVVLCLHDELLVHCRADAAHDVERLVHESLWRAARGWAGGDGVRFVADASIVRRWSEAKG